MIRELREEHLTDATDEDLAEVIRDHSPDIEAAAIPLIVQLIRQPPKVRGAVASYLRYTHLFCVECGETSCVHGYPDI